MIDSPTLSYTLTQNFPVYAIIGSTQWPNPPLPPSHVISLCMLHGSSSFYLSRVISVSKVIQREKWNQALYKRRIEFIRRPVNI